MTVAIHTEGLTKYYGRNRGIVDLDLDVPEGEIFGYLGPNGAGKTTTIRLLLDFIRPTRGQRARAGLRRPQPVAGTTAGRRIRPWGIRLVREDECPGDAGLLWKPAWSAR